MLIKATILFLLAMVAIAMIGRLLFPGKPGIFSGIMRKPSTCPKCGRYVLTQQGCDCAKPRQK